MKIGIAITNYNRPEVLKEALAHHVKYLPKDARLVIVDDCSFDKPEFNFDYVFPYNAGIASAKNKCLELLEGCEHIFLFDSDCFPKVKDWHLPYIKSGIKHLSFTFPTLVSGRANGRNLLKTQNGIAYYGTPCGCMLYIHRSVIDKIGGFDVDYPQWGFEHVDYSRRAYNAKLISHPYMDVSHSLSLFHSLDYHQEVAGSVPGEVRRLTIQNNRKRFSEKKLSKEFIPYNNPTDGILLASYFNSIPDPQRKTKWNAHPGDLLTLVKSCRKHGVKFKIFHDCLPIDDEEFTKVDGPTDQAPNVYRWEIYLDWLLNNPIPNVWMVDSTDVEVLRNPFQSLNPNKLYSGDENQRVDNFWMRSRQQPHLKSLIEYRDFVAKNRSKTLLNCGLVGGGYDMVIEYLSERKRLHRKHTTGNLNSTDMAVHNFILYTQFVGRTTHGLKINTTFKRFEKNDISYFRHK